MNTTEVEVLIKQVESLARRKNDPRYGQALVFLRSGRTGVALILLRIISEDR